MAEKLTKKMLEDMVKEIIGGSLKQLHEEIAHNAQAKADEHEKRIEALVAATSAARPTTTVAEKHLFGRYIKALGQARLLGVKPAEAAKALKDSYVEKALGESSFGSGGFMLPPDFANEVVAALRSESVVFASGARAIPMPLGTITLPRVTTGASAAYVGENANITKSELTGGQIALAAKKLALISPVSNDLLRDASPLAAQVVQEDAVAAMAERMDLAFIRDDGTSNKPKGFRHLAISAHVINETNAATGANNSTLAEITSDLGKMVRLLKDAKIKFRTPGWIMTPRTESRLLNQQTTTGAYVWRAEMEGGKLLGFPYKTTAQIPTNLAAPTANSQELYLVEFSNIFVGETNDVEVSMHDGAAYHDGSAVISGLSQDQSVLKAIARHDLADRYAGKSIVVLLNSWGLV